MSQVPLLRASPRETPCSATSRCETQGTQCVLTISGPGDPSTVGRPDIRPRSDPWPGDGIESIGSWEPDMSMVESEGDERPWNDIRGSRVGVSRGSEPRLMGEGGGRERPDSWLDTESALLGRDLDVLVPDCEHTTVRGGKRAN